MNDTQGVLWQFYAGGLQPGRRHSLSLTGADGKSLCEPWDLSTFPAPASRPDSFRVLFFTCAGGPDGANQSTTDKLTIGNLPTAIRNRLLRRALTFQPQAMVANGDHVYWDLHSPRVPLERRDNTRLKSFDRSALIFGNKNETVLKIAAGPQIAPVYGTDFRSTPVFFLQDDHDYFDNDEAFDEIITFPPVWFQLQLARATQKLYYPEFLPDEDRPRGLPWGSVGRWSSLGELGHHSIWPAGRSSALRCPPHVHARRPHGCLPRPGGRALVAGALVIAGGHACGACAQQSDGVERGEVDGVVSRRAQSGWQAHDQRAQALLAERLDEAARPAGGRHDGDEGTNPADHQRRSSRGGDRKDTAFRLARSREEPAHHGVSGPHRHCTAARGPRRFAAWVRQRPSTSTCEKRSSRSSNTASRSPIFCRIASACGSSNGTSRPKLRTRSTTCSRSILRSLAGQYDGLRVREQVANYAATPTACRAQIRSPAGRAGCDCCVARRAPIIDPEGRTYDLSFLGMSWRPTPSIRLRRSNFPQRAQVNELPANPTCGLFREGIIIDPEQLCHGPVPVHDGDDSKRGGRMGWPTL